MVTCSLKSFHSAKRRHVYRKTYVVSLTPYCTHMYVHKGLKSNSRQDHYCSWLVSCRQILILLQPTAFSSTYVCEPSRTQQILTMYCTGLVTTAHTHTHKAYMYNNYICLYALSYCCVVRSEAKVEQWWWSEYVPVSFCSFSSRIRIHISVCPYVCTPHTLYYLSTTAYTSHMHRHIRT